MDGFLTPNVADTRSPRVVVLHNGCIKAKGGGLTPDGNSEKFNISLLDEEPQMPSAARMLEILAENPVAQAIFFYLEHAAILGTCTWSDAV